jgi:DNA repair protein RadC
LGKKNKVFSFPNNTGAEDAKKEKNPTMVLLRQSKLTIGQAADVAKVFQDLLKLEDSIDQDKEYFYVCHLDSHRRINLVELVAIGTLTSATIHPRETYRRVVIEGSYSIIISHNYPSGDPTPSDPNILITNKLRESGEILQILLLDHIIFTATRFYSFLNNKTEHYAILTKPKQTHAENYGMKKQQAEGGEARYGISE